MTYETVLKALSDPTRRRLVERLRERPRSVNELAQGVSVSQPAVSQHLSVLKEAGLVQVRTEGTRRIYSLSPVGLLELQAYIERLWDDALNAFQKAAEEKSKGETP